ncbi:MAG: hypothetical protein GY742_10470 [Hyphomicrobiales bacterium]|nr:hypothetical protein [Hyphomicrobiales bacterium]
MINSIHENCQRFSIAILFPSIHLYPMTTDYEPATLADLDTDGDRLMVFCRQCGHFRLLHPAILKLPGTRTIPSLANLFRCTKCSSRNTAAEPRYASQVINAGIPSGEGWISPPE